MKRVDDRLPQNLKFLRNGINLSVNELADLIEVDPIDLYLLEERDFNPKNVTDAYKLISELAQYYLLRLDSLFFDDLTAIENYDPSNFTHLKNEINGEKLMIRKKFRDDILNGSGGVIDDDVELDDSDESAKIVMKAILKNIQGSWMIQEKYYHLRKRGIIDRNPFFEGE